MKNKKFSINFKDEALRMLTLQTDHRTLAMWAIDCVKRVLPYYKQAFPDDPRPQCAIAALQDWIETGQFSMKTIREAALAAHAAAREVGADTPARSAARAAGQAVATAHVPAHAIAAANYALQAVHRALIDDEPNRAVADERTWQYQRLVDLQSK
jgi:hypothetical protein